MEPIDPKQNVWNQISKRITENDYDNDEEGLAGFYKKYNYNSSRIRIFKTSFYLEENTLCRLGDLLVGFYAVTDCTFDLVVSNEKLCSFEMKAGEFSYAIQGKYVLPLIKMQYNIVKLENATSCPMLVYAQILERNFRKSLALCSYQFDIIEENKPTTYSITQGMCSKTILIPKDEKVITLPNMHSL
jgi:hypothetical protein